MNGIWAAQIIGNLILAGAVAWLWWRGRGAGEMPEERLAAYLNALESRAAHLEAEVAKYRQRMEAEMLSLVKICREAQALLDRGRAQQAAFPSAEENELKELAMGTLERVPAPEIPTLQEIEKTRARLRSEVSLDLKTLLRDQLA